MFYNFFGLNNLQNYAQQ